MATIRKRGAKWQVQVRRKGCPPLARSFIQKSDAQAWARQVELEADRGDLPVNAKVANQTTVADIVQRYIAEIVPRKRGGHIEALVLGAFLRHRLSQLVLSKATTAEFAAYRDERLKRVRGATIRREFSILRHCFDTAMKEWGVSLKTNPIKQVTMPPDSKGRDRRLEDGDGASLLNAMTTPATAYLRPFVLLLIETGMRRGELLSIRWKDVDLKARTIHIAKTKNGYPRTIPLTPKAVELLATLDRSCERVFSISPNAVRLAWVRLRKRAGLEGLRMHDLRHEAVSRFFEYGLSVPEVALISGHRDTRMLSRYTHLRPERVAEKLAQAITG
ncbi:site-specific integrase [Ancylobacter sp. WKF20]|uniref:site-specific integrase n=1 Tax=Ancylobacter sp. WKF20 TaxID=3039801 RepID=UPI002434656E|nr:site-specific integrase [Ancylobacter sp. WKF20]WGD28939.1 site-specific integrase [Ancylobacter sp. WKF20]